MNARRGFLTVAITAIAILGVLITGLPGIRLTPANAASTYITIGSPGGGATVHGTITVATKESANVSWVNFYVDGLWFASNPPAALPPYSVAWNSKSAADGKHTLSVNGYNSSNVVIAGASVNVTVRNSTAPSPTPRPTPTPKPTLKPTPTASPKPSPGASPKPTATALASTYITITSPAAGATVSNTITLATHESSNVSWVNFYVDNVCFASNPPTAPPPYWMVWNSNAVGNGSHTLSVDGYNSSNVVIASAKITVNVENFTSPTPTMRPTSTARPGTTPTPRPTMLPTASPKPSPSPAPSVAYPLSDAAAAAKVTLNAAFEPRPGNYTPNHKVPNAGELALIGSLSWLDTHGNGLLTRATGNYTGTTDEILQWAAYKWGFDPDITRANAVTETHWYQYDLGDIGNGVSLGILQIKSRDYAGTCNPVSSNGFNTSYVTDPNCLSYNYTAFAADYKLAYQRACMDGSITYLNSQTPTSGYPTYANATGSARLWGCIGDWYSGNWYDSGALSYIKDVQNNLANKTWLQPGF